MSMQTKVSDAIAADLAETIVKVIVASRGGMLAPEAMHRIGAIAGIVTSGHQAITAGTATPLDRLASLPSCPAWIVSAARAAKGKA